jgi:hypothetical protein
MSAPSVKRAATEAGLGDAAAAIAPPPPPPQPQPPDDYSDLAGMLTHPDLGGVLLGWIADDTVTATVLRGVSRGCRDGVAAHRWADTRTRVWWPARWRAAFPAAEAAKVGCDYAERAPHLCDADFVHFRGLHTLSMSWCSQITDAAFVHLAGIHTLYMSYNIQETITDAAFSHLAGIHTLDMSYCRQITDAAFAHLAGIQTLDMSGCFQITDAAFAHLTGIHALSMRSCNQTTITDAAYVHLAGIHTLDLRWCNQDTITAAGRARLAQAGIPDLHI